MPAAQPTSLDDLDPAMLALVDEARARGIPWSRIEGTRDVLLGQGRRARRIKQGTAARIPFADGDDGRVPTCAITGSVGKTTTTSMTAAIVAAGGKTVARTSTQGAWIGDAIVQRGDFSSGAVAVRLLQDRRVDAGVFEVARGSLLKRGLCLDTLDVGAVLNVEDNHLGLDGIATREQMAEVKRVVVEHARNAAVLNAEDALCLAMRAHLRCPRVLLVAVREDTPALVEHRAAGGACAWLDAQRDELVLWDLGETGRLPVSAIRDSWGGRFRPALWHSLFAMAITHAMGIAFAQIDAALRAFRSTPATNPGRMNLYENLPYSLLVVHADGPGAKAQAAALLRDIEVTGSKTFVLCTAGNRSDDYVREAARVVAGCADRYVCSDWVIPRERPTGEIARLLAQGLREAGVPEDRILVGEDPDHAVRLAYDPLGPGDFVVDNTYADSVAPQWLRARGVKAAG